MLNLLRPRWLQLLATVAVVGACGGKRQELTAAEVDRLIDQRLEARGLVPSASASARPSASASAKAPRPDRVAASAAFIASVETLMHDYQPTLPPVEDKTDDLRCVTTDALKSNADLAKVKASLVAKVDAARRARDQKASEFFAKVYPVGFRIDYDWKTRKTEPVPGISDCFNATTGKWTRGLTATTCADNPYSSMFQFEWRVKVPGTPALFLYSNSETPPDQAPEMMRRIETAKLKVPKRFSCRVADVLPETPRRIVRCESTGTPTAVRVEGEVPPLNVGDVISAPLAETRRDPDGVLSRQRLAAKKAEMWVLDAAANDVVIDVPASCPSIQDVLTSANEKTP